MNLQHLCSAPNVTVYFDSWNNWLFVDWEGDLTLPNVQHACLSLAKCYLTHSYPRVLNSNIRVTSVGWDVPAWLASDFLPALGLAGVRQLAWVCSPTISGFSSAFETLHRLPHMAIALFNDIEQAVTWLQHSRPAGTPDYGLLPRPLAPNTKLAKVVRNFANYLDKPLDEAVARLQPALSH